MKLRKAQLEQFDTEGWLFLPDLFGQDEIQVLKGQLPKIFAIIVTRSGVKTTGKQFARPSLHIPITRRSAAWGAIRA